MQSKETFYFFIVLFQIITVSCSKCKDSDKMIGEYETEKKGIEIRDSTKGRIAISHIKLYRDNTLALSEPKLKVENVGKWRIISCETVENNLREKVPESILEFEIDQKKTRARYRDGRITFEYPEDLYGGRYQTLWYVKINNKR